MLPDDANVHEGTVTASPPALAWPVESAFGGPSQHQTIAEPISHRLIHFSTAPKMPTFTKVLHSPRALAWPVGSAHGRAHDSATNETIAQSISTRHLFFTVPTNMWCRDFSGFHKTNVKKHPAYCSTHMCHLSRIPRPAAPYPQFPRPWATRTRTTTRCCRSNRTNCRARRRRRIATDTRTPCSRCALGHA